MKVFLTGAAGSVAKAIAPILMASAHEIKAVDIKEPGDCEYADYSVCNILDYASLKTSMRSCDTIIHLAGIPNPNHANASEIFRVNCQGTFNLFRAAEENGINKILQASSINALGYGFGMREVPIEYFPIDEDHPAFTTDPYSFSKKVMEDIAAYFCRRLNINSISFRIAGVSTDCVPQTLKRIILEIMDLPESESRKTFDSMLNDINRKRGEPASEGMPYPSGDLRSGCSLLEITKEIFRVQSNLLALTNPMDLAQAMMKGLEKDFTGCFNMYLCHDRNCMGIDSARFIKHFFPKVSVTKKTFLSDESLISVDFAKSFLGFKPEFTGRTGSHRMP